MSGLREGGVPVLAGMVAPLKRILGVWGNR